MSQVVIALVGLSGVGKSTLLRMLGEEFRFQHLQASALIKDARIAASQSPISSDVLRFANIEENQQLLVEGFNRARSKDMPIVVLDGHTVIDTPDGLQNIKPEVFAAIGVNQFIFLADDPAKIAERRSNDANRIRPERTSRELENHQNIGLLNALGAALWMSVPVVVVAPNQTDAIRRLFQAITQVGIC